MTITFSDEASALHGRHNYCSNDNSKTKHEWKAFAMTLFPF